MTKFQVTILGCGSAMPTTLHNPSSQLVDVNEKLFMIDCGEEHNSKCENIKRG